MKLSIISSFFFDWLIDFDWLINYSAFSAAEAM